MSAYIPIVQTLLPNNPVLIYYRALNHLAFRPHVVKAVYSRFPNLTGNSLIAVWQAVQAVALIESSYGQGWKPPGNGSNNTGAVQCPGCGDNCFEYVDSHPNPDGSSTKYRVCFKRYASLVDGLRDQIMYEFRLPETLDACMEGNLYGVSFGMHKSGYYEGFGATKEERIMNHYNAMKKAVVAIAAGCNERVAFYETVTPTPMQQPSTVEPKNNTIPSLILGISVLRWLLK
jgi:hypothetical protein